MEVVACYNCGSDESSFYAKENGFSLVKCNECGLLYVKERPNNDEISQAHKQGKHSGANELKVTGFFNQARIPKYLKVLGDLFEDDLSIKGNWLDVGCGHGEFMLALKQFSKGNLEVEGTEPNVNKRNGAKKRGLQVDYFDLDTHQKKYDFISLLNVYSHLPDPPAFLESLKRLLNTGGEIIIQTGDTADFPAKEHYKPFLLPDHLSFASEKIVTDILKRIGFEILEVKKYPFPLSRTPKDIIKELIKVFLPGYPSRILLYLNLKKYSKTDMYIRARKM